MLKKHFILLDPATGETATGAAAATGSDAAQQVADAAQKIITAFTPFAALAGPDGELAVVAAEAALKGYKLLLPYIEQLKAKGLISADQQERVFDHYTDIVDHLDEKFAGPQWQIVK
jgi:hypothetical protein